MPLDFGPLIARVQALAPEAAMAGGEALKGASQRRTPVESGNLRGGHDVRPHGRSGAEVYVPGPYARYQHYGLNFRHETGQALYLETATVADAPEVLAVIAATMRGAF